MTGVWSDRGIVLDFDDVEDAMSGGMINHQNPMTEEPNTISDLAMLSKVRTNFKIVDKC